jgi:hypothetical protein
VIGPNVDEVGVADAIGEDAGGADDVAVGVGEAGDVAVFEGFLELGGGAAVVEVVFGAAGFHFGPVYVDEMVSILNIQTSAPVGVGDCID